jgi:23S rRNA pseudouridine1911/1915/1917 synthase
MEVIYLDNHLLAAIKPAGLATQPHEKDSDHFLGRAKKWIKAKYDKPGNVFLEPVHRLDKPVGGIVLFARTTKALSRLQAQMREKEIEKTYLALIEGKPPSEQGTLEHFLLHASHRACIVSSQHPEGKWACLHYRVVQSHPTTTLIEISLETGRYHQIRAQLSAIKCPVVGDRKYGSKLLWEEDAIALQHLKMVLKHPVTLQELILENNKQLLIQKLQTQAI